MNRQKGVALVTVVLVMAILVLVVGVSIILAKTEVSTSQNNARAIEALALAEAGIDYAIAQLRDSNTLSPKILPPVFPKPDESNPIISTTMYLPTMSTTVTVIRSLLNAQQGTETATVTAYSRIPDSGPNYPAANRALRVVFSYAGGTSSPTTVPVSNYWKRPITTNGTFQSNSNQFDVHASALSGPGMQSNAAITGNSIIMNSNNIQIEAGQPDVGYMNGASARLTANDKHGTTTGTVPSDLVPQMDFTYWAGLAKPSGSVLKTAAEINSMDTVYGPVYVNGNLNITRNNIVIYGPLYVGGNFTVSVNNIKMDDVVYASGNITINSNTVRVPADSTKGLTMVAGGTFTTGTNVLTIDGIGGYAILAQGNVAINSNTFNLVGLLYAGGNFQSNQNTINLTGAFAVRGNMTLNTNTIDITWKDFSAPGSDPPPGTGGSGTGVGTGTGQWDLFNWQEIEAVP
jgi:hypothetical protein